MGSIRFYASSNGVMLRGREITVFRVLGFSCLGFSGLEFECVGGFRV